MSDDIEIHDDMFRDDSVVDPHYSFLVKSLRRKAREIADAQEGRIADCYVVRDAANSAYLVLRLEAADQPLLLIHGISTVDPRIRSAIENGDVGIHVNRVPWNPSLLPIMSLLAQRYEAYHNFCPSCGHEMTQRDLYNKNLRARFPCHACPACGTVDYDPESGIWSEDEPV